VAQFPGAAVTSPTILDRAAVAPQPKRPARRWVKPAVGAVAMLALGVAIGASGGQARTVTRTVTRTTTVPGPVQTVTVPGPERTVTVAPQACLDALDAADDAFGVTVDWLQAMSEELYAAADVYSAELAPIGVRYTAAEAECKAAGS